MSSLFRTVRRRRWAKGPILLFVIALAVFSVLFLNESPAHSSQALVSDSPQDVAAGQVLYEQHCQACHGYQGSGGVVTGAPALVNVGAAAADFYLTTGRMPLNAPNNEALRHHQTVFTGDEIRQLDSYIAALPTITGKGGASPGIPNVEGLCANQNQAPADLAKTDPGCVTLSEGQELYAINCAQCHQAAGSGGMLSGGNVIPGLHNSDLTQIAEAPMVGPKPMPVFSNLTNAQLSAIAQYVHYLHKPQDPGGFSISHFGPVAEGFIGIAVGFALLWFASRMIGNRG
ncbi:MAG TPA: c-type cytochrome [Acidimicrobiales bacterium]|jgi:ubiquinol-cytochrome c reductase cytochrome c subunit|nr:c-type cytochrome [Acidimicrobiales bacterium]